MDIFCDDPEKGRFRIHLTARQPRFLLPDRIVDGPALDELLDTVCSRLDAWGATSMETTSLGPDYMPLG